VTLSLSFNVSTASGQNVGVKVGDWVKYQVKRSNWFAAEPLTWTEGVQCIKAEVQNISGTAITVQETMLPTDGSQQNTTHVEDLQQTWSVSHYFLPANLNVEDRIRVDEWVNSNETNLVHVEELYINATIQRNYDGSTREINQLKWSYLRRFFGRLHNFTLEYYWDKETGFVVERTWQMHDPEYGNASMSTLKLEIAGTNLWEMETESQFIGSQWVPWIALGILVTGGAATVIYMNQHEKNRSHVKCSFSSRYRKTSKTNGISSSS
jgi:hypothetical protein